MFFRSFFSLIPACLLALFVFYCGTFSRAGFLPTIIGTTALISISLLGLPRWRSPLGEELSLRFLPWALLVSLFASWLASPVRRAGTTALLLVPVFLLIPAAIARCWQSSSDRRIGLRSLVPLVAAVSMIALYGHFILGDPRPSWPLGHHSLLAGFLLVALPMLLPLRHETQLWRWLAALSVLLGCLTLLLARSLAGWLGLGVVALVLLARPGRRWLALAVVALLGLLAGPRIAGIADGRDVSFEARRVYADAAMRGIAERVSLGWGPGSSPWTIARYVEPTPGVNPAGELVTHPHNLPLQLAYELGLPGALIAFGLLVALWRRSRSVALGDVDSDLALGSRASLAGFAVWSLGGAPLEVAAIPLTLAVVVGAGLAATGPPLDRGRGPWWIPVALGLALLPGLAAEADWDRAIGSAIGESDLATAVSRDATFPLYRSRRAEIAPNGRVAAEESLAAARMVPGSSVLWIRAGKAGLAVDAPWTAEALAHACRLDPLGPFAPYLLFLADRHHPEAASSAARALLAEPRLGAATVWRDSPELLEAAVARLEHWPGVDEGWRAEAVARLRSLPAESGSLAELRLVEDGRTATSSSLFVFRRRPWPSVLVAVEVEIDQAAHLDLVPAFSLTSTRKQALVPGCR